MKWTAKHEAAALAVAEDILSDVKIAEATGVTKKTLEIWKREPEFRARVDETVSAICAETQQYGIARMHRRVGRQNADYKALQQIILDRAAFYQSRRQEVEAKIAQLEAGSKEAEALAKDFDADGEEDKAQGARIKAEARAREASAERRDICFHPGMETGWLLVQYKQFGVDIVLDTGTEAALRALEMQAAKELGQWTEKRELTGKDGAPLPVQIYLPDNGRDRTT